MRDSFIHITDLHFWEIVRNPFRLLNKTAIGNVNVLLKRRREFIMERAWDYVDYIASLPPREVIITGDFASTSTTREFQLGAEFCKRLTDAGKSVTVIPGNHDVYTFKAERRVVFGKHFFPWLTQEPPPCIQPLANGTPVLYIPTVCANFLSSKGRITAAQLHEVESLLRQAESPIVVAAHYPVLNETEGYVINENRQLREADQLRNVIGASKKSVLYVCGHVHRFSDTVDALYPNVRHVTTGALFRTAHESGLEGDLSVIGVRDDGSFDVERHVKRDGAWAVEL